MRPETFPRQNAHRRPLAHYQTLSTILISMKPLRLFAAAASALFLAASAKAQTKVYIAGAPALRTELTSAIENLLVGQASVQRAFNGSAIITANVVTWTGATVGGNPVTIKLNYNGSAGGWKTNSARQNVRFLPDSVNGAGANQVDVLTNTSAPAENGIPDFHISNEFQESTPWSGTNSVSFPENGPTSYSPLIDRIVGIMPIKIVASPSAPAGLNLTPQLAQQLFANGELRLSQLTGNSADYTKKVYPLSRGIDSGVRTLWASANGLGSSTPLLTWQATVSNTTNKPVLGIVVVSPGTGYTSAPTVTITGGGGSGATATATVANGKITGFTVTNQGTGYNSAPSVALSGGGGSLASARAIIQGGTVTAQALWPATTLNPDTRILGVSYGEGNGGYATFGPLLTAITSTLNLPGGNPADIYITPLATSDAESALQGGAKEVSWNGVYLGTPGSYGNVGGVENTPSPTGGSATPALANGSYDLWGYVRLPYRNDIGAVPLSTLNAIATQLQNFDAPVLLKDVNVQRFQDGGTIVQGQYVP